MPKVVNRIPNKVKHRATLLGHLCNPENRFCSRGDMSVKVLGFSDPTVIYTHFTPDEISEIEGEALMLRRRRYAGQLAAADAGLLKRAATGDPAAVKLCYQVFEGYSEKTQQEIAFDGPMLQQVLAVFPPEIAEKVKAAIISKQKELT